MADDPIARLADILFAANQVGNIASFHRDELEAILRSTHAGGRREMAEECAHAVVSAAGAEARWTWAASPFSFTAGLRQQQRRNGSSGGSSLHL